MSTEIRTTKKRTTISQPNLIVQKTPVSNVRASMGGYGGGGNVIQRSVRSSTYSSGPGLKHGVVGQVTREGVSNVMQTRDKEKSSLQSCNKQLASYIEKVRFLEANMQMLTAELENLRKAKGYEQKRVMELVKEEMDELRQNNADLQAQLAPLQSQLIAKDDDIDLLNEQMKDKDAEIKKLYDKIRQLCEQNEDVEADCKRLKNENDQLAMKNKSLAEQLELLQGDNKRLRSDTQRTVAEQLDAQQRVNALEEELAYLDQVTGEEITELKEIIASLKSSPVDVQSMWKQNFASALENIDQHYKEEMDRQCDEMRRQYEDRMATIQMGLNKDNTDAAIAKSESKTLKSQLGDKKNRVAELELQNDSLRKQLANLENEFANAREECEKEKSDMAMQIAALREEINDMMEQIETLKDKKMSLDLEISCYKKLLEGEEKSIQRVLEDQHNMRSQGGDELASIIMGGSGGGGSSSQQSKREPLVYSMSESTGNIRVKKSSKQPVTISTLSHDGAYVGLENGSASKDFDLSNWTIERTSMKGVSSYSFPSNFTLKKGQKVTIFSADFASHKERKSGDFVADGQYCSNWGVGNGEFTLKDTSGNVKSTATVTFQ